MVYVYWVTKGSVLRLDLKGSSGLVCGWERGRSFHAEGQKA